MPKPYPIPMLIGAPTIKVPKKPTPTTPYFSHAGFRLVTSSADRGGRGGPPVGKLNWIGPNFGSPCTDLRAGLEPEAAMQRLRPLRTRPRTHADRNLAVVRFGGGGQREGRLYEVQRAQAARTVLTAALLTASLTRQLAVSTRYGPRRC